jgi:hypothetical protein
MPEKNLDLAGDGLNQLVEGVEACMNGGGFNNKNVIWMIKAWTEVNLLAGLTLRSYGYWQMKRLPAPLAKGQKRSQVLLRALDQYLQTLGPGRESGDYWVRADEAMLNFVWDYRQHILDDVDKETDFVHQIMQFMQSGGYKVEFDQVFR